MIPFLWVNITQRTFFPRFFQNEGLVWKLAETNSVQPWTSRTQDCLRHDKCRHSGQKTGKWWMRASLWVMRYSVVRFSLISFLFYVKRVSYHLHLHNVDVFSFRRSFRFVMYSHLPNVIKNSVRMRDLITKRMRTRQLCVTHFLPWFIQSRFLCAREESDNSQVNEKANEYGSA